MTTREQNIERFDAYLSGRLAEDQKVAFELELEQNEVLKRDFEAYEAEVTLIKTLGIRDEMAEVMDRQASKKESSVRRWLIPVAVAAAVVLLVLFIPGKPDHKTLFNESFRPFPNAVSGRDFEGSLTEALNFYDRQKYEEAIDRFEKIPGSDTVTFYKGISHLALNQPRLAIESLSAVDDEGIFTGAIIWYLGLSHLLLDQPDSSAYYIRQVKDARQYAGKAAEILDWAER